jgi:hypothetical protein
LPIDIPDAVEVTSPEVQPDTADTSTEQDVFMECYNGVAMDAKYPPK